MYRVLIVDDEEPVLDSFSFMLKEYTNDFILAGKARNGYEALKMIHEIQPDVVFMDINIPGMDGLKVIDSVHEKYPQMIFVLSTAYERFDLAQRAIPLGVHAYLVKPISKKMFIATLEEVKAKLIKNSPLTCLESKDSLIEKFFLNIMNHSLTESDMEMYRTKLEIGSNYGNICIIEIEERNELFLRDIASKIALKYFTVFYSRHNRGYYFISGNNTNSELRNSISEIIKQCIPAEIECVIGIGTEKEYLNLDKSYDAALDDLFKNKTDEQILLRERIRIVHIRKKIGYAKKTEIQKLFETYWEEVFEYYDLNVAKCKMAVFINLLLDDLQNYYKEIETEINIVPVEQEIMNVKDINEWKEWSNSYFNKLQDLFLEKRSNALPAPLLKAIQFVKEHYAEPIQLTTVADEVLISPAYLSRLFAEYMSTTFIDFLTDLRITEAQRLMKSTNMNIKEIGSKVGYSDPNYFSKCFKKYSGYTPTDFLELTRTEVRSV
ncbi:MAG TPA: response regulator [Treponema sp.]|nr:response regulator [Treponema sp.]HPC71005.1 response regulator [Treponema sp.]HRS03442.1 response regulator [Treponema sp.]